MSRKLKVLAGDYVEVEYRYQGEIEIPGTTGRTPHYYLIKVEKYTKEVLQDALRKFSVEAAHLPHSDRIEVLAVRFKHIAETPLN